MKKNFNKELLIPTSSKQYAKRGGCSCPNCNSTNIEGGPVEIDAGGAFQNIDCLSCGSNWIDEYKLTGYTGLAIKTNVEPMEPFNVEKQ